MGGHSASLDLAIVDELGLMSERDRELVASMRAATSAKDGKFLALSICGSGPYIPEILERREHPGVKVHLFQHRKTASYRMKRHGGRRIQDWGLSRVSTTCAMRRDGLRQLLGMRRFLGLRI